ncbi:MAG: carboxymuconolactone decarboxylase family protein [Candidatus Aerophobetes bacterium]|nr:carboxymuconolactone decarboxylase family protein [Candidatus Aerophobetes bacterium]
MGEMKERYEEFLNLKEKMESMAPEKIKGWNEFTQSLKGGILSEKVSHLIAIVAGMIKGCEWCIAVHTHAAIEAGATKEEILEACWIAVEMDGGPGLVHIIPVMEAIEEFTE